jgi:hypothetical protein
MNIYQVWADERNGMVPSGTLRAACLDKRIAELETALREIQEQLFSSWFSPDMVKQVVRKALEGKCGFSMEGRNE